MHYSRSSIRVAGNANECIFGATVGTVKVLGLERDKVAHALGIGAYLCPPPARRDWEEAVPKSMIKYVPVGWVSQGAVTAALFAKEGFTGNPSVLDGACGFWRFYGAQRWDPEVIVHGLGNHWRFMEMTYKRLTHVASFCIPSWTLSKESLKQTACCPRTSTALSPMPKSDIIANFYRQVDFSQTVNKTNADRLLNIIDEMERFDDVSVIARLMVGQE